MRHPKSWCRSGKRSGSSFWAPGLIPGSFESFCSWLQHANFFVHGARDAAEREDVKVDKLISELTQTSTKQRFVSSVGRGRFP